jgi:ribosomal protein L11 methyltransferase
VVAPDHEEPAVVAFWDSGCLGVQVLAEGRARRLTLDAYFSVEADKRRLDERLRRAFQRAGLGAGTRARLSPARARRWVESWQRTLRPITIGPFLVVPEGCRAPAARGRAVLRVRFGQAFGTGEHATTRLCLRLLSEHLVRNDRVVDLGTGSGILAMAALRLGASRVVAADNDDVALEVARANLAANGLAGQIELRLADASRACRPGPFDLALVNIGASTIERILPPLALALAPGGRAILAGLLVEDEKQLLQAATRVGLVLEDKRRSRPWSALVLRR